jgi:hypothetical protein
LFVLTLDVCIFGHPETSAAIREFEWHLPYKWTLCFEPELARIGKGNTFMRGYPLCVTMILT